MRRSLLGLTVGVLLVTGAACGGASGPSYTPVSVTTDVTGTLYMLNMGDLRMVVDSNVGGRITEFSLDGTNVLTGPDLDPINYGGTFWPSPQSDWCQSGTGCWPPIGPIDSRMYAGTTDPSANTITLTSQTASITDFPGSALTITKSFTPVPTSGAVDVTYTITNLASSVPISAAPWQVSRVQASGGLTYFASPDGTATTTTGSDPAFAFTDAGGDLWWDYAAVASDSKALADGSGWLAHVSADGLLYTIQYPDIQPADAAPGEAEVEVFTGPEADYLEMEAQGVYSLLAPGDTLVWTVTWKLRKVPGGTSVTAGSPGLVSLTSATLAD